MNRLNVFASYQAVQMETASRERLLIMLYEGAIRFLNQAVPAMAEGRFEAAHGHLLRAQDILAELMATLDFKVGGEIARNLYRLYEYGNYRLAQANLRKDPQSIAEVIELLQGLLAAWNEAVRQAVGSASHAA